MLSSTRGEYPEFIAGVSMMFALPPEDARAQLELRAQRLEAQLADTDRAMAEVLPGLPRLFLLEAESRRAVLTAELEWRGGVIGDLRHGRLTWSEQRLRETRARLFSPGAAPARRV
jgi:hypothetical protein